MRRNNTTHQVSDQSYSAFFIQHLKTYNCYTNITGFRDAIIEGLEAAGDDLEAVTKFLDTAGKLLLLKLFFFCLTAATPRHGLVVVFTSQEGYIIKSSFNINSGQKLDYRRYGVNLIEILIAGGLLAPGGIVHQEGENVCQTKICLFGLADSMEKIRAFEQVIMKTPKLPLSFPDFKLLLFPAGVHQVDAPLQIP